MMGLLCGLWAWTQKDMEHLQYVHATLRFPHHAVNICVGPSRLLCFSVIAEWTQKASRNCNAAQGSFGLILASHFLQHGVWPVSILLVSHHMRQHTHGSTRSCTTEENSWVSGIQDTCRCCRAHQPADLQSKKIVLCFFLEKGHWFELQEGGTAGPLEE
jgi:hypothetical protein